MGNLVAAYREKEEIEFGQKRAVNGPKVSQIAKLCFSVVLRNFRENLQRTSLFSPKSEYLIKEHRNTQKVCFS